MTRRTAFVAALLLAIATCVAGCARSFERDAALPLDAGVDAPEAPLDLYVLPLPPPVCGEPRALPTDPVCEAINPAQFDGCAGAFGAVFDGTRCVEVRACPDRASPFADRYECALSCASRGECNEDLVTFVTLYDECCAACDVFWTDALDVLEIEALCATIGHVQCDSDLSRASRGELCVGAGYNGPEAFARACAWSLVSTQHLVCHTWLY